MKDIREQWDYATKKMGIKFEPWTQPGQPYKNSAEMVADVRNNHHLYFFRGGEDIDAIDHPMAPVDPETGFSGRDMFRAVHDLFGHAMEGYQFGPRGEENAWNAHTQMFSPEAVPALTALTKGQNSWVNYGPHMRDAENKLLLPGQPGYIELKDRPYPPQKVGILPEHFQSRPDAEGETAFNREKGYRSAIDILEDEFGVSLQKATDEQWRRAVEMQKQEAVFRQPIKKPKNLFRPRITAKMLSIARHQKLLSSRSGSKARRLSMKRVSRW